MPDPRATDAIGDTLRAAFGAPMLPDDMIRLLHAMDAKTGRH